MPTRAQIDELKNNTTYTWEENFKGSGINGGKFTAVNGNYLFVPAAGYQFNGTQGVGRFGEYWGSTSTDIESADCLGVTASSRGYTSNNRMAGLSVRGVCDSSFDLLTDVKDELNKKADKSELPTFATISTCEDIISELT
jgi:hypothetical protein